MKRLITIIGMAVCVLILNSMPVRAAEEYISGDYKYTVEDGYAVITGYVGTGGEITIPGQLDGYEVQVIGEKAFFNNDNIESVKIENNVRGIRMLGFGDCNRLQTIIISSPLTFIETGSFSNCQVLRSITLPSCLVKVEAECFDMNPKLEEIKVLPQENRMGFFSIDGVLFCDTALACYPGNKSDIEYYIPDFVTNITMTAFNESQNLSRVIVPGSVEKIGGSGFSISKNPIDIILKHEMPPIMYRDTFDRLASGSQIICRNEAVRSAAAASINGTGVTAVIGGEIPATDLQVTSGTQITVNPSTITQITWKQMPQNTTENVTWTSSDPTGLSVEPLTGKLKAMYRGTYTVTGTDESGHTVKVQVTVPTQVANVKIEVRNSGLDEILDKNKLEVDERYRIYAHFNLLELGTNPEIDGPSSYVSNWLTSKKCSLTAEDDQYYPTLDFTFIPQEVGEQTLSFEYKDKSGVVVAKGEIIINVLDHADTPDPNVPDLSNYNAVLEKNSYEYTGKEIKPVITSGSLLTLDQNYYTVTYEANINPGTGYVVVTGINGVKGSIRLPFRIKAAAKEKTVLTGTASYNKTYGDKSFTLNVKANAGQKLQYTSSNTKAVTVDGAGKVSIKGVGKAVITAKAPESSKWTGAEKQITIQVKKASISKAVIGKISDQAYTGKAVKPSVKLTFNKKGLKNGADYTVTYKNNTKIGTATISIKGKGNFTGSRTMKFKIAGAAKPSAFTQKMTGKTTASSIQLTWKKVSRASGYRIYRSTSKNGKYKKIATINKGTVSAYTDKRLKSGTTYYYKIRAYRKISGKYADGTFSSILPASTKPSKVALHVKAKSRAASLTWKRVKGAAGYEIYRGASKNGKYSKIKTLAKGSVRSYTNSRLFGTKKYYYKVRAYRVVNGKKVYGDFSIAKYVRIKK